MDMQNASYTVLQDARELTSAIEPLTRQEDRYIRAWISGMPPVDAIDYAGLPADWAPTPGVEAAIHAFRQAEVNASLITKERLTIMFLESHAKASQVSDEINAAKELGKLHGLYESDKQRLDKHGSTTVNVIHSAAHLERLTDAELLSKANIELDAIEPPRPVTPSK